MGNEISRKRYCCRKFRRLAAVQENTAADHPTAQAAPGAVLWSRVNHPPKEQSQDTATGMHNKDARKESDIAPSSIPEAQVTVGTAELQELGEAQPSGNEPTAMSSDTKTCAPTQERPAAAQQANGDTGVTSDLPAQTATETGTRDAEDVVTEKTRVECESGVREGPRKMCKPSPLCRWLKKLKSPAKNAKAKPDAITGQE